MTDLFHPAPLAYAAIRSGVPFLRAGLNDDEAVQLITDVSDAACQLGLEVAVHLVDDLGGADLWTLVVHPASMPCVLSEGIHQFDDFGGEHGCSS